ncbi:MAG TPA: GNAT family N-acetyltransferase [Nocardioides sp.]|nr:GNAT family N-acetyltransferase [Nocardioides sp.]
MTVRKGTAADAAAVAAFLERHGSTVVARHGELLDATDRPALMVEDQDRLVGLLTYVVDGTDCEVLTLHADPPQTGVGTELIEAVAEVAAGCGCHRLWLITTNDNVGALRFYQRRGFRLVGLHPGAVDRSRRELKPQIPEVAENGIPIRDELDLERPLAQRR